jgi:hypothetical protein
MLRWTMGGANDNRKSRAEVEEQMTEAEEKRVTLRKRQKELQERKYHGQKASTKRIDSFFARTENSEKNNANREGKQNKKRKGRRETKQTKMEHAMTGQNNLNADVRTGLGASVKTARELAQNKKNG